MWQLALYLKLILRGWHRNPLSFGLSVLSLILGLTCSLLCFSFVVHELRISNSLPVAEDVYLLRKVHSFYEDGSVRSDNTGPYHASLLAEEYPEITDWCVIEQGEGWISADSSTMIDGGSLYRVSSSFADFFNKLQVTGNLEATLASPDRAAIARSLARKWFGDENPLGKRLCYHTRIYNAAGSSNREEWIEITAVIEDEEHEGFFVPALLRGRFLSDEEKEKDRTGWSGEIISFVRLGKGVDPTLFGQKLDAERVEQEKPRYFLSAANDIYFGEQHKTEYFLSRDRGTVRVAFWVALSMLFVALFNYVNLTMTRTLHRLRNVGQQWVFGASRTSLSVMLFLEAALHVLLSLLCTFLVLHTVIPHFNRLMDARMAFDFLLDRALLLVIAGLIFILVVLPALYILWMISGQPMAEVIKGKGRLRKSGLTRVSVVAQFSVSIVLLILGINVQRQMNFVAHVRPSSESIYRVRTSSYLFGADTKSASLVEALKATPLVAGVSFYGPFNVGSMSSSDGKGNQVVRHMASGDEGYLSMYGMTLVAGRNFIPSDKGTKNVIVNETLVASDSLNNPIGATIDTDKQIIGVVKDVPVEHFSKPIQPLYITYSSGSDLYIKSQRPISAEVLSSAVELAGAPLYPDGFKVTEVKSIADIYLDLHAQEIRFAKMVSIFTLICFLISCLGLFGLAWYAVERRVREVAVRKVHGATVLQVAFLLSGHFLQWILLSFLLALPPAFFFSKRWFSEFVYKVPQAVWVFALGGCIALFVGLVTVFWQTRRVAMRNPIRAIRHE